MIVNPPAIIAIAFLALAEPEGSPDALDANVESPTWRQFAVSSFFRVSDNIEKCLPPFQLRQPVAVGVTAACTVIVGALVVGAVSAVAALAVGISVATVTSLSISCVPIVVTAALVAGVVAGIASLGSGGRPPVPEPEKNGQITIRSEPKVGKITKISFVFENNNFYDKKLAKDFEFIATVDNGEPHKFEGMDKEEFLGKTIESFVSALPKQNEPIKIKLPVTQDGLETLIKSQLNDIKKSIENAAKKQQKSVVVEIVEHTSK